MFHHPPLVPGLSSVPELVFERREVPLVPAPDPGASEGPGAPGPGGARCCEPAGDHQRQVHLGLLQGDVVSARLGVTQERSEDTAANDGGTRPSQGH